jgi:hypothetical protein
MRSIPGASRHCQHSMENRPALLSTTRTAQEIFHQIRPRTGRQPRQSGTVHWPMTRRCASQHPGVGGFGQCCAHATRTTSGQPGPYGPDGPAEWPDTIRAREGALAEGRAKSPISAYRSVVRPVLPSAYDQRARVSVQPRQRGKAHRPGVAKSGHWPGGNPPFDGSGQCRSSS